MIRHAIDRVDSNAGTSGYGHSNRQLQATFPFFKLFIFPQRYDQQSMPHQPGIDASGASHPVIARGIGSHNSFDGDHDLRPSP